MAKAKYTRGADGYFCTKVWDGTYNSVTGKKNRKTLRTKKSSKALENMVNEYNANVSERKNMRKSDITFFQYAYTKPSGVTQRKPCMTISLRSISPILNT